MSVVTINRYALVPNDATWVPVGKVLHVGFVGAVAYAWIMHHPEAPVDAQILTLPSETPLTLTQDERFNSPEHVGSFFKTDKAGQLPSCWHCLHFLPAASRIILPN